MSKSQKNVFETICDYIKKQKLTPIPVQTLNEDAESTRYFGGDLKEFISAAKILNAKGIFVEELYLEDDEFYYDSGMTDEEYMELYGENEKECCCNCKDQKKNKKKSEDSEVDGVWFEPEDLDGLDLSLIRPEIAKYQGRIGECCGARLTVPGVDHLEVEIFADWYDKFAELVDEASEKIEDDPNNTLQEIEKMFKEQEKEVKSVKKIAVHPPKKRK